MKNCTRCNTIQEEENFYKQTQTGKNGQRWFYRDSMCIPCRGIYGTERRQKLKTQAVEYLGGKCVDCGLIDDHCVYDFHHTDPSMKDYNISKNKNSSFDTLKKELDKCVLLCANCHRKRHYT